VEEDNIPIPDDINSLEAELEFQELEKSIAQFNKGYDEPIDNKFLWNYIGARQMGYGDDELQIIEDTAFSEIMDYMDKNDLHYSEVNVYDFIPEDKRLTPYLIFKEGIRNEYYTDDFVEYMIVVTRRTPSGIYDPKTDDVLDAPPSHYMAEYALKGATEQGAEVKFEEFSKIVGGNVTEGYLSKLKFKDFFEKAWGRTQAKDLIIRHVNNLFPGGSYEAYLEESFNRNMADMGFTPEGDWLPEIKEKMVIKHTDIDGKVTYTDFYGNELSPDDPRISDESKFDDLVKQLETPVEELTEEQQLKKLLDNNIITEREYEELLKGNDPFTLKDTDTPTNVVDDVVITKDQYGRDVTVSINEDGYITLYRATDDPNRILNSDFSVAGRDAGSVGFGQQNYFSTNPMYAYHYDGRIPGKTKTYKFNTNIKPSEVLPFESYISDYPELAKALNIPIEFWMDEFGTKTQWNTLLKNDNAMIKMGYEAGGKRFLNDKIQVFIDNGIKAFGTLYTGTGGQTYIEYEIVPLIKEGDTLGIKPVAQLTTKEGYSAGKVPEAFTETPLDTPTNVVDDVSNKVKNLETELNNKYSNVIADIEIGGVKQPTLSLEPIPGQNSFVIKNLYIDDTLQGQGYGTQIMNDIIEFADSNNLQIELDISATNKSLATYYEKFGFELTDSTGTNMVRTTAAGPKRNQTLRVMEDTPDITNASTRVQQVAIDFAKTNGLAEPNFNAIAYFNPEVGVQAADVYQGLPDFDDNAVPLYNKFIKETNLQYDALNSAGLQFELVDTDPYTPNAAGHQQMINDMQNGRLKVLATSAAGEIPPGSPMAQQSGYVDVNGRQMLNNDVFRAVHDTFGHGMRGNTFGPIGEYNAWLAHKEMYSPTAQRVMTTETLGQNTWVNFGPHMRTEDGVLIGKGDSGYIGPADRPFAPQKVAVMPEDIITNAGTVVDNANELVSPGAMNKVQQFISNTPDAAEKLWKATKFTMGKAFRGLQVFDPGDIIIEAGLARLLPRLGLAAIAGPALYAYVFYELAVLTVDVGQAYEKARENQGLGTVAEAGGALFGGTKNADWRQLGKDTWSEMGEVSDDWSLSWKISEPIINKVFEEYGKMKTAKDEKDYFTNLDVGVAAR
jgi:hypothetical protein